MSFARRSTALLALLLLPAAVPAFAGDWRISDQCGARTYERRILFMPDRTFSAVDAVAPCPKEATCAWPGVVTWKGRYVLKTDRVELKPDRVPGGVGRRVGSALLVPLPASLDRDPATGALSERAADGTVCPYRS